MDIYFLGSATGVPNFVEIGEQLFGVKKKKKNTNKIRQVSGAHISGTAGAIPLKFGM